jgi:hypothetical protein
LVKYSIISIVYFDNIDEWDEKGVLYKHSPGFSMGRKSNPTPSANLQFQYATRVAY